MDTPHNSPRLSAYPRSFSQSALSEGTHASVVAEMPVTPSRPYRVVDFTASAKAYRRSYFKSRTLKMLLIFSVVVMVIITALGAIGYALNQRYAGRALPYTYVGDISIGGLTQAEIKAALDKRASEIRVTLTEGGLIREVPLSEFGPQFDTQKASEGAITGFNPFSYLTKRTVTVPVQVNERYVDGYLRMNVANMQTDAKNAEIVKAKKGLTIVPEAYGFRTNTGYITEQLNKQLANMQDPVVNLSAVTDRPNITQADLQDDVELAKKLIATNVGLKAGGTVIRPTEDQKLSWLEVKSVPNSSEIQLIFSQTKVREYVFEAAKKYITEPINEQVITNPDGTKVLQPGKSGSSVTNIDEVANSLHRALTAQQAEILAFTITPIEYQKLDPAIVAQLHTVTTVTPSELPDNELAQQVDTQ